MRTPRTVLSVAAAACLSLGLALGGAVQSASRDWTGRLERLNPNMPSAYFELAEDIADVAVTKEEKDLARTLFALSGALDRERYGRSAALALAQLAEDLQRRRALTALASLLGDRKGATGDWSGGDGRSVTGEATISLTAAIAVSEAFSHYRRGQGQRATSALRNPEVEAILVRLGTGSPGGVDRFREDLRVYKGGLRPQVAGDALGAMLAIEEAALAAAASAAEPRSWSSTLIETNGRPLIEIDAARVDEAFGVNSSRPYYRKGRWVASGE